MNGNFAVGKIQLDMFSFDAEETNLHNIVTYMLDNEDTSNMERVCSRRFLEIEYRNIHIFYEYIRQILILNITL